MYSIKHRELFSIKVSHEFYEDGVCEDFRIYPSPECARKLRSYRLRFKEKSDGGLIFYEDRDNDGPLVEFNEIDDGERFTFLMELKNPNLLYFTSLGLPVNNPVFSLRNQIFYFDSVSGDPLPAGQVSPLTEVNLLPGDAGTTADPLIDDEIDVTGNAKEVMESSDLVSDPEDIIGSDTLTSASLSTSDETITVELQDTVAINQVISLTAAGADVTCTVSVEGSYDGENFVALTGPAPVPVLQSVLNYDTPATGNGIRYLRITNTTPGANRAIDVALVAYNYTEIVPNNEPHNIPKSIPVSGPIVNFLDDTATLATAGLLEVFGPEDPSLSSPLFSFVLEKVDDKFKEQINLQNYPTGKYTLQFTPNGDPVRETEVYMSKTVWESGSFGVIEVRKSDAWDNVHTEASGQTRNILYSVDFTPRKAVWRYVIVQKTAVSTTPVYSLRDDEDSALTRFPKMVFADKTLDYTYDIDEDYMVFVSVYAKDANVLKPIRMYSEANSEINLYKGTLPNLELVREDLSNPSLSNIQKDDLDASILYSDVFIYV